jgi:hypothetical protein
MGHPELDLLVRGKVVSTILRGEVVYDGKDVIARPGTGRFVSAQEG